MNLMFKVLFFLLSWTITGLAGEECPESCDDDYAPVCGSDGVTYSNECALKVAECQSDEDITKEHDGECKPTPSCPVGCDDVSDPVCGSDGVTYGNECELKVAACNSDADITKERHGKCNGEDDD